MFDRGPSFDQRPQMQPDLQVGHLPFNYLPLSKYLSILALLIKDSISIQSTKAKTVCQDKCPDILLYQGQINTRQIKHK